MGSCREIITFQLGNYSNYVGAHWWNIQESSFQYNPNIKSEICHDVLYREGKSSRGETTFTPRLVLVDDKTNFNHLPSIEETPTQPEISTWDNTHMVTTQTSPPKPKHDYQTDLELQDAGQTVDIDSKNYNFSETVSSWCDFLRTRYHPKSILSLDGGWSSFQNGVEGFRMVDDEFSDRVRVLMEECDNLEGFQVLVDAADGFGGFGNSVLLHLQDEYSSKTRVVYPLVACYYPEPNPKSDLHRTLNCGLALQALACNADCVVPLSTNQSLGKSLGPPVAFPNLDYKQDVVYQTSAILATYLDTMSLKYRLTDERASLRDVTTGLTFRNRPVCAASLTLPFPIVPNSYLLETLEGLTEVKPFYKSLTPGCDITDTYYQNISIRGIPQERLRDPKIQETHNQAYTCTNVKELFQLYLGFCSSSVSDVCAVSSPMQTATPFPQFFTPHVSTRGSVDPSATRMDGFHVSTCPVVAGTHGCAEVGDMLERLHSVLRGVNVSRHTQFVAPMESDEFGECLESLISLRHAYEPDYEMD